MGDDSAVGNINFNSNSGTPQIPRTVGSYVNGLMVSKQQTSTSNPKVTMTDLENLYVLVREWVGVISAPNFLEQPNALILYNDYHKDFSGACKLIYGEERTNMDNPIIKQLDAIRNALAQYVGSDRYTACSKRTTEGTVSNYLNEANVGLLNLNRLLSGNTLASNDFNNT